MSTTIQYIVTPSDALTLGGAPQVMEELEGSPRESLRNDGMTVTREFEASFDARLNTWAAALLAHASAGGSAYSIYKPMEYTHAASDGSGNAQGRVRVAQVDFRPFGDRVQGGVGPGTETWAGYDWALATVSYRGLDAIVEELQVGGEFVTLGAPGLYWDTGAGTRPALSDREAPGVLITQALWSVTRRWLPAIPPEYFGQLGTVNSAAVSSTRFGVQFATGTLLYQAPVIRTGTDRCGHPLYDVTARFAYRPNGWNKFWRAQDQQWEGIVRMDPSDNQNFLDASPYASAGDSAGFALLCQYQVSDL